MSLQAKMESTVLDFSAENTDRNHGHLTEKKLQQPRELPSRSVPVSKIKRKKSSDFGQKIKELF